MPGPGPFAGDCLTRLTRLTRHSHRSFAAGGGACPQARQAAGPPRPRRAHGAARTTAGGACGALGGCGGSLSTLDPAGPASASIATLWWWMLGGAGAIFVLVMALLAAALLRRTPPASGAAAGSERAWLAGAGLAFPLLVLSALLAYGLVIGERLIAGPAGGAWQVEARAAQWQWRFRHAATTPAREHVGRLDIPAGRPVEVHVSSDDVIHSFWVPRLAGKVDAVPGKVNTLRIEAAAPGRYEARCAEYCGIGHAGMRFVVVAHDAAGWAAWMEGAAR